MTKIQSIGGAAPPDGLVRTRPFRSPHTDTTTAGMIGGTASARPGEVTLAHAGALFLDELPEFRRETLEALRQPLEDGEVTVVRAAARFTYPARFLLIAAMNPCPCGHLGNPRRGVSLPARIDRALPRAHLRTATGPDRSPGRGAGRRVSKSWLIRQEKRVSPSPLASRPPAKCRRSALRIRRGHFSTERWTPSESTGTAGSATRPALSSTARTSAWASRRATLHRVQRVARTIADLDQAEDIAAGHLAEALQYRSLDRSSML